MSDPKYNKYAGTVRFDDDNIVDIDLQPDTENIRVLLNGSEVTGSGLPEVTAADNGDVLTVVEGIWAKAAPSGNDPFIINVSSIGEQPDADGYYTCVIDKTANDMIAAFNSHKAFMVQHLDHTLYPASCIVTYDYEDPTVLLSVKVYGLMDVSTTYAAFAGIYIDVYQQLDPQYFYATSTATTPGE